MRREVSLGDKTVGPIPMYANRRELDLTFPYVGNVTQVRSAIVMTGCAMICNTTCLVASTRNCSLLLANITLNS